MHHPDNLRSGHLPPFAAITSGDPQLVIRHLVPSDEPAMSRLLCALDQQARLDRFGSEMSDAALTAHARHSLATSPAVFGALINGTLSGVAEIAYRDPAEPALMGFVVNADWRRQGVGSRLLLAALAWAQTHGLSGVQLQCARTNWAVRKIAQKANARVSLTSGQFLAEFSIGGALRVDAATGR